MPTIPVPSPTSRSPTLPDEAGGVVIDMPQQVRAPRLRQRVIVLLDSSSESLRSAAHLFAKYPSQSAVVALRVGDGSERALLLGGEEVVWDGAKIAAVGHGDAPDIVMERMRDLSGYLKTRGCEPPVHLSLLCCDAAGAHDDAEGTLLDAVHAVFAEADLPAPMSGYSGGVHVGADGRRYAAEAACRKLALTPGANGSVERAWLDVRRIDGNAEFYLGKSNEKGKKSTEARKQARAEKAQGEDEAAPILNRKAVGRFLTPARKVIKDFAQTPIGKLIADRLKNSDLAHRMSFEDIKRCVASHPIDSEVVQDLITTLTIPSREYGGVPEGDRQYYDYVTENLKNGPEKKAREILIKLLNSIPFNLRPGDSAENRAIGQSFDPNLDQQGKKTPLSQSIDDLGRKHPGILSPAKEFTPGMHRHPDNVGADVTPEHRSSTSLGPEEQSPFEKNAIALWGKTSMRKYSMAQPFRDASRGTR